MSPGRGPGGHYAVCDCCDLEYPAREGKPWRERKAARRLKVLETAPDDAAQVRDGNPYREYWVEQDYRVCPACHAELTAGGQFRALHKNRSKMAVLAVAAMLAVLIVTLPFTLPHLMSALYMLPRGR